jgi:hypothetical protein
MSPTKIRKKFDCVEFKRKAQAEIYADIEHLSPSEQVEYFRRKADSGPLGAWWASVKRAKSGPEDA